MTQPLHPNHSDDVQRRLIATGGREEIIDWLCWNDRNGIYSDADCTGEDQPHMTREMALAYMLRQCNENIAAEHIAGVFKGVLKEWLTLPELAEIDRRNAAETNTSICHSHDFCDPNQAMIDAFALCGIELDPRDDDHFRLSNAAWAIAKKGFYS